MKYGPATHKRDRPKDIKTLADVKKCITPEVINEIPILPVTSLFIFRYPANVKQCFSISSMSFEDAI